MTSLGWPEHGGYYRTRCHYLCLAMIFAPRMRSSGAFCLVMKILLATGQVSSKFKYTAYLPISTYAWLSTTAPALTPHTIYVGTALLRSRPQGFDGKHGGTVGAARLSARPGVEYDDQPIFAGDSAVSIVPTYPRVGKYSIAELCLTLLTVTVFVDSALAAWSSTPEHHFTGPGGGGVVSEDIYSLCELFGIVYCRWGWYL